MMTTRCEWLRMAWANIAQARCGEEPVNALLYLKLPEPSDVQTSSPILSPFRVRVGIILGAVHHGGLA